MGKLIKLADATDEKGELLRDPAMTKSLELLGKTLGIWQENVKVDMTVKTFEQQLDEIEE